MDKPRDVIARELPGAIRRGTTIYETGIVQRVTVYPDIADAIIAALNDAGFEIVQRDTYIPIMLDPTMPENEIEVRSDVDSVRVKFVPIQKPEPDWGRRGTQPKGTLGDPPPPNGKLVATKPKPE